METLEYLQNKPEATIDDILLVIQQREQTVQFDTKQSEPTESVFFVQKGSRQQKNGWTGKKTHITQKSSKICPKCGAKHEPGSCPAFGKTCNSRKRHNHFAKIFSTKKTINQLCRELVKDWRNWRECVRLLLFHWIF